MKKQKREHFLVEEVVLASKLALTFWHYFVDLCECIAPIDSAAFGSGVHTSGACQYLFIPFRVR
jgi:hypothetical protein